MSNKVIKINSLSGGKGDIWMRLVSFYAVSKLTNILFQITIPVSLEPLAKKLFEDRILINYSNNKKFDYNYTSLGLRHIYKPLLKGNKFIVPYAIMVFKEKKKKTLKDIINFILLQTINVSGRLKVSPIKSLKFYQGYTEVTAIKRFARLPYKTFINQLITDRDYITIHLKNKIYYSSKLTIPNDLKKSILVFPTGTGRQFFPLWWCMVNLPNAYYAFYYGDNEKEAFKNNNLKIIEYYSPEDIIALAKLAKWCVSSDSFPSHLLQYVSENCTIAITGTPAYRVISPVFKGNIVNAVAPCHPCIHLDRGNHLYCEAGFTECINWKSKNYTDTLLLNIAN